VERLASGSHHNLALTNTGRVLAWGSNAEGQLGLGEESEEISHVIQEIPLQGQAKVVACGNYHSAIVSSEGKLWTFGDSEGGKLGLKEGENEEEDPVESPVEVPLPEEVRNVGRLRPELGRSKRHISYRGKKSFFFEFCPFFPPARPWPSA